jgi:hypothetical protein
VTTAKLLAALENLDALAAKRPEQARAALLAVVESVVLTPTPDGKMHATLRLKNETATIAGGRLAESGGCGGGIWSKTDLLPFARVLAWR